MRLKPWQSTNVCGNRSLQDPSQADLPETGYHTMSNQELKNALLDQLNRRMMAPDPGVYRYHGDQAKVIYQRILERGAESTGELHAWLQRAGLLTNESDQIKQSHQDHGIER